MTKEELREHCEKQVKMCEEWAKGNNREPSGKIYEEHKLILDLIKALEQAAYYKNLAQSYEKTINKLTKAIAEQQPSEDCVSRQAVQDAVENTIAKYIPTFIGYYEKIPLELALAIKDLPPVTPTHCIAAVRFSKDDLREICNERIEVECTHGTCKDCANYVMGALDEEICLRGHELIHKDFYCADFEKRGGEDTYGNT